MSNDTIIFYSPLQANIPDYKIGGAEAGCKRTVEVLEKMGYPLRFLSKPTMTDGWKGYLREAWSSLRHAKKIFREEKQATLYLIGYYERNVWLEYLLVRLAKKSGQKVIYEPKNGNMISAYEERGRVYRSVMRRIFRSADLIFCQGTQYADFLRERFAIEGVVLPNYVMDRYLELPVQHTNSDVVQLVYFGRVTAEKRIELILDTSCALARMGVTNELTIIGACTQAYQEHLERYIREKGMDQKRIHFTGGLPFEQLLEQVRTKDFFLFPSANKKEGHSNALTEAMAMGVIPVVSPAGFNREVLGKEELVIEEQTAERYAQCMFDIVRQGRQEELRKWMVERVKTNYTESIVTQRMKLAMDSLMDRATKGGV
ncbi:MAG: glycosyltransferase family 4 protein [Butyricicoccus sp.]